MLCCRLVVILHSQLPKLAVTKSLLLSLLLPFASNCVQSNFSSVVLVVEALVCTTVLYRIREDKCIFYCSFPVNKAIQSRKDTRLLHMMQVYPDTQTSFFLNGILVYRFLFFLPINLFSMVQHNNHHIYHSSRFHFQNGIKWDSAESIGIYFREPSSTSSNGRSCMNIFQKSMDTQSQ